MHHVLGRNNVTVFGSGTQPIVFGHGFGCDQTIWRFVTPAFADTYRIVLFDYVGSGKSEIGAFDVERYKCLEGYAQDVLDVCVALDLRDMIFVGHSISGMIGLLASIQAPERFAHLVMLGSSPRYLNDPPSYIGGFNESDVEELLDLMERNYPGWASMMAPAVMQNNDRPELAGELEMSFLQTDPFVAHHFATTTFYSDRRNDLPRVSVPSLLLQSSVDMIVPAEAAEYLHQHLPASTMRIIKGSGHYMHLSHVNEVVATIQDYLAASLAQQRKS